MTFLVMLPLIKVSLVIYLSRMSDIKNAKIHSASTPSQPCLQTGKNLRPFIIYPCRCRDYNEHSSLFPSAKQIMKMLIFNKIQVKNYSLIKLLKTVDAKMIRTKGKRTWLVTSRLQVQITTGPIQTCHCLHEQGTLFTLLGYYMCS